MIEPLTLLFPECRSQASTPISKCMLPQTRHRVLVVAKNFSLEGSDQKLNFCVSQRNEKIQEK